MKIISNIYSNNSEQAGKIISQLQPEERIFYYAQLVKCLVVQGKIAEACNVVDEIRKTHEQLIEDLKSTLDLRTNENGLLQEDLGNILYNSYIQLDGAGI